MATEEASEDDETDSVIGDEDVDGKGQWSPSRSCACGMLMVSLCTLTMVIVGLAVELGFLVGEDYLPPQSQSPQM